MLKFITSDASTLGQKRKVSPRACELCRKRKRRCDHTETLRTSTTLNASMKQTLPAHQPPRASPKHASTADASPGASGKDHNEAPGSKFRRSPANPADVMHPATANVTIQNTAPAFHQAIHGSHEEGSDEADGDSVMLGSRFIGDLNPEGMFLAATSPNKTTTNGVNQMDSIGIWLAEKLSKRDAHKSRLVPDSSESNPFYNFSPFFQKVLFPMLAEECLSTLPPPSELEFLSSIYFEKHHPIFPVIDADAFRALDHLDPAKILLKQGICLVASMDPTSRTHLRLPNTLSTLGPRDFGRRVSSAMRISIETGLVTQNVVLTQAFALLSGFIEGPSGRDVSSQLCGRAVHCLHSAGLHLESTRQSHSSQYAETLTCCIWALDRLNAAFHGRPVLMHERDIGRNLESCFRRQKPCFQLFLRLILLLDKAIDLYRPRSDKSIGWTGDFPLFEELLVNSDECHIPTPLLGTFISKVP
jgi:hypothetical protein